MELDVLVIGAGPGGYVAAIRAAQLGQNVGCAEKEEKLGGTCLRIGCIPSKALLESSERFRAAKEDHASHGIVTKGLEVDLKTMLKRKDQVVNGLTAGVAGLLKKNKVAHLAGLATFKGQGKDGKFEVQVGKETVHAARVIIATGSSAASLPGIEEDGTHIGCSTSALQYDAVPKKMIVIGAGAIGLELGSVWSRLGAEVTVLEYLPRILPACDAAVAKEAQKILAKQGLEFKLGVRVVGAKRKGKSCEVTLDGGETLKADRVLVSVGRKANTEGLGLEAIGLGTDARGRIEVNDHFETAVPGIFAIGDVIHGPMLAHKAEEDGVACVEGMVNGYGHVDYNLVPSIVYTEPEVASVGKTEEALKEEGVPYQSGKFRFGANGRALAQGHAEGFTKILAHKETDRILGVHIIGPHAGELIAEAATAMTFGASAEDLARTCHAHPTLAEVIKEAALDVDGRAIHR